MLIKKQANPFQFFNQDDKQQDKIQKITKNFDKTQFIFKDNEEARRLKKKMSGYQIYKYTNKKKWKFNEKNLNYAFIKNIKSAPIYQMQVYNSYQKNISTLYQDWQLFYQKNYIQPKLSFLNAIKDINFINLKVMRIQGHYATLQFIQLLQMPNLTHLQISICDVLNLKFIKKTHFKNLQFLFLQNSDLNLRYDNALQIMKVNSKVIEKIQFDANWIIYPPQYFQYGKYFKHFRFAQRIFSKLAIQNIQTDIKSSCSTPYYAKDQTKTVRIQIQERKYRQFLNELKYKSNREFYYV